MRLIACKAQNILSGLLILAAVVAGAAEPLLLRVPGFSNQRHVFYVRLLEASLRAINRPVRVELINDVPQGRVWRMVESGELTVFWGLQTRERDTTYVAAGSHLTNGLIGQRVLLIRKESQPLLANVASVADLKKTGLIAGFAKGWFDVSVWSENGLPVYEKEGDWTSLYKMVSSGNRPVDYMPRGVNEIVAEAQANPSLAIEERLLLTYDRDMRFYLSPKASTYQPVIEEALRQADKSGLKKRLIDEIYGPTLTTLNLAARRPVKLRTPAL